MAAQFYKLIQSLDLFQLLEKVQDNIILINDLRKFNLPTPVCIENEQNILNFYLAEKWLNDFPKQSLILKLIEEEKKLFYLPESEDFYYLYYHLLIAFNNYLETGQKIYDDETQLNYIKLNDEIIEKQLIATKFFEIYLKKGSNFSEEDFFLAKKGKGDFYFINGSSEMIPEEVLGESEPQSEPEPEVELKPETKKEDNSQVEVEVEELNLSDEVKFESFV